MHRANIESSAGKNQFDAGSVIAVQEIFKLCISLIMGGFNEFSLSHLPLFFYYSIPAILYTLYNNITFTALNMFDPTTYFVLMQFRIVVTAFLSVVLLGRRISVWQWLALFIIMAGAMLKEVHRAVISPQNLSEYGVIGLQILLSVVAGLVTEYLLKQTKLNCPISVQNVFMYANSLIFFFGYRVVFLGEEEMLINIPSVLGNKLLLPVVVNAGIIGVTTSFFLKHLSSVHKSIASAIELWITAVFSSLMFGYTFDPSTFAGIAVVTVGVLLYSYKGPSLDKKLH